MSARYGKEFRDRAVRLLAESWEDAGLRRTGGIPGSASAFFASRRNPTRR